MQYTKENVEKIKRKEHIIKKISLIIICFLLFPIILFNTIELIQIICRSNKTPEFFGIMTYSITYSSMEPEINKGDLVIAKKVKEDELKVGDIIGFRQGQKTIFHRITKIIDGDSKEYKTKGNNNTEDSGTIRYDLIDGKFIKKIPFLGNLKLLLKKPIFIFIILCFMCIIFCYNFKTNKKAEKRRAKRINYENSRK